MRCSRVANELRSRQTVVMAYILPREACIAIVCRLSVRLSRCPSIFPARSRQSYLRNVAR